MENTIHHKGYESRCVKKKYASKQIAEKIRKQCASYTNVRRSYFCPECKSYHLTSIRKDWYSKKMKTHHYAPSVQF